jgi:hypothetical protein
MPKDLLPRRTILKGSVLTAGLALANTWPARARAGSGEFALAPFVADVTIPIGHPCMGGGIQAAARVDDPLSACGVVLLGGQRPVVLVAVDWCEIRNEAFDRWREALAEAAQTSPDCVLVSSVHQHDAPVADLAAQRLLEASGAGASVCDLSFHERAVQTTRRALSEALKAPRRVTHLGVGKGEVQDVASNRRYHLPDGSLRFDRTSACRDAVARDAELGTIDPWLKTISFWDGDAPVAAISAYATHPMSYYGQGGISCDFVGLARNRRQSETGVHQIYLSGASGNVTAGRHNDGAPENRAVLAGRMHAAMSKAWETTQRQPLEQLELSHTPLRLEPRDTAGFTVEDLQRRLKEGPRPFDRCLAAMGLAWRARADAGHTLDMPVLDLGGARLVLLPGESYVEYQLKAQSLAPDAFVVSAGYGECATGYVPIERAWQEGDGNLGDWCWVAQGSEAAMNAALAKALSA